MLICSHYSYFFFLRSAAHRTLHNLNHSFPTRRSSDLSISHICRELSMLNRLFKKAGIPEYSHDIARNSFWRWERNSEMPFGRIMAYMFAALAAQVKAGRRKGVSAGFMNDVEAVAA